MACSSARAPATVRWLFEAGGAFGAVWDVLSAAATSAIGEAFMSSAL